MNPEDSLTRLEFQKMFVEKVKNNKFYCYYLTFNANVLYPSVTWSWLVGFVLLGVGKVFHSQTRI